MIEDKVSNKPKSPAIQFRLNKTQTKQLDPLFELANIAYYEGDRGMVLMRLQDFNEYREDIYNKSIAIFVPGKYAKKIQKIMDEYKKELEIN